MQEPNEFLGSPIFIGIVIVAIVAIGLLVRMLFHTGAKEYKHRSDD